MHKQLNSAVCCSDAPSQGADDSPRQADLPYPMSAWTWEQQEVDWMKVPYGEAGLGLQVCPCIASL